MSKSIIPQPEPRQCYVCGARKRLEVHHVMYGHGPRHLSEKYGLKVTLCDMHHRHAPAGIHAGNRELDLRLKAVAQTEFEKIYASSFFYDEDGVAVWPAQVVNFTNKTQFLFRISKGVLGINDDGVNDYFAPDEMRVPFRNMVYIGDSDTDIPCMKLVNSYGGHSIGVYDPDTENKARVQRMMRENRIRYYAPADYTEGSELDRLLQMVLDKTAAAEKLENVYYEKNRESGSGAE